MNAHKLKEMIRMLTYHMPDAFSYQIDYLRKHGRLCNFSQPSLFSEKIFYRMRYPDPIFSRLADKVRVRDYIAKTVGDQYLVPIHLVASQFCGKEWAELPRSFVLKSNHSAGQVKVVFDKSKEDVNKIKDMVERWMESNFYYQCRERHYYSIKPMVLYEQILLDNGKVPSDYKVNVFTDNQGEQFIFIQLMEGRFDGGVKQKTYLEDWSPAPFKRDGYEEIESDINPPAQLKEMVEVAKKIGQNFGYVRVDFYVCQGRLYIGELTFTPAAGGYKFSPSCWDRKLGDKFGRGSFDKWKG